MLALTTNISIVKGVHSATLSQSASQTNLLLKNLLDAKLSGVTALLLTAVSSTWGETSVTPVNGADSVIMGQ